MTDLDTLLRYARALFPPPIVGMEPNNPIVNEARRMIGCLCDAIEYTNALLQATNAELSEWDDKLDLVEDENIKLWNVVAAARAFTEVRELEPWGSEAEGAFQDLLKSFAGLPRRKETE